MHVYFHVSCVNAAGHGGTRRGGKVYTAPLPSQALCMLLTAMPLLQSLHINQDVQPSMYGLEIESDLAPCVVRAAAAQPCCGTLSTVTLAGSFDTKVMLPRLQQLPALRVLHTDWELGLQGAHHHLLMLAERVPQLVELQAKVRPRVHTPYDLSLPIDLNSSTRKPAVMHNLQISA